MTTLPTMAGFRQAAIDFYSVCLLAFSGVAYAETPEEALAQLVKDIRLMTPTMAAAFADGRYITKKGDTLDRIIAQTMDDTPVRRDCLLYTSPSPRDVEESRMPSSA